MVYMDLTMATKDGKKKVKLFRYPVGKRGRERPDTLMSDTDKDAWKVDDIIRNHDGIVCGIINTSMRKNMMLDTCIQLCRAVS